MAKGKKRWPVILGVLFVCGTLADQITNYTLLAGGEVRGRRVAPFDPPLFNQGQRDTFARYDSYMKTGTPMAASFNLDADFGWVPPKSGTMGLIIKQHFDEFGCRVGPEPLARVASADVQRIVTTGCSFTLGEEVEDDETWVYQLDEALPSHEFANLAVSAYGLDQALLRYRRDGRALGAQEVWLGWLPVASLRLLTVYRPAQRHWTPTAVFKPRFRLDEEGELELIPCPIKSPEEVHHLLSSQDAFFAAVGQTDYWIARAPLAYAPYGSSWLHYSALGRIALTLHENGHWGHVDWIREQESELSQLLFAIVTEFAAEVEADGARFRFLLLPGHEDVSAMKAGGPPYWEAFIARLEERGIEIVDCSPALLAARADERDELWAPGNHYSPLGNSVIAQHLQQLLAE